MQSSTSIQVGLDWCGVFDAFCRYANFRRSHLHDIEPEVLIAYEKLRDRLLQYPNVDLFALKNLTSLISGRSGNEVLWSDFLQNLIVFRLKVSSSQLKWCVNCCHEGLLKSMIKIKHARLFPVQKKEMSLFNLLLYGHVPVLHQKIKLQITGDCIERSCVVRYM